MLLAAHVNPPSEHSYGHRHGSVFDIAAFPAISFEVVATPFGLKSICNLQPSNSFKCTLYTHHYQEQILAWLQSYAMQNPLHPHSLLLDIGTASPFQQAALSELQRLAFGETASYQMVAKRMGCPQGARAVGNACNKNPLPLLIPCHRVLASNGALGGFAYGLDVKTRLLEFERPN